MVENRNSFEKKLIELQRDPEASTGFESD